MAGAYVATACVVRIFAAIRRCLRLRFVQPNVSRCYIKGWGGRTVGDLPGFVVSARRDAAVDEDGLDLKEHILTGGEYRTVRNEDVLHDVRIREDDDPLVANYERVERAVLLRPFVQAEFGVLRKVGEYA